MEGCRTAWGWPRDRKRVLNHAAQCGYLAAIDKDLTQRAVEELSRSHSGIVDRLSAKVGVVTKKRTHEDLNIASFSKTPGDPAPPLKRSKTEPLLSVDKIPGASESGSKQVIRPGQNFAEMFQMEGKKVLKENGDQALVEFVIFNVWRLRTPIQLMFICTGLPSLPTSMISLKKTLINPSTQQNSKKAFARLQIIGSQS